VFWSGLFEDLKERGLTGVKLVVSDGHTGIQKAAEAAFLGASWQTRKTRRVFLNRQISDLPCVLGPLHSGGFKEYSPETSERSC